MMTAQHPPTAPPRVPPIRVALVFCPLAMNVRTMNTARPPLTRLVKLLPMTVKLWHMEPDMTVLTASAPLAAIPPAPISAPGLMPPVLPAHRLTLEVPVRVFVKLLDVVNRRVRDRNLRIRVRIPVRQLVRVPVAVLPLIMTPLVAVPIPRFIRYL